MSFCVLKLVSKCPDAELYGIIRHVELQYKNPQQFLWFLLYTDRLWLKRCISIVPLEWKPASSNQDHSSPQSALRGSNTVEPRPDGFLCRKLLSLHHLPGRCVKCIVHPIVSWEQLLLGGQFCCNHQWFSYQFHPADVSGNLTGSCQHWKLLPGLPWPSP